MPADELADGFVTTQLDAQTLEKMRAHRAIWVAKLGDADGNGDAVAAYACAVEWNFYHNSRFVEAVFEHFPLPFGEKNVNAANSFIYGPACIAATARGQGILPALIDAIKARYAANYDFGVCFVDVRNARSLSAHERKLGFARIATLPFGDVTYYMLAFETAESQ